MKQMKNCRLGEVVLTEERIKELVADAAAWLDERFEGRYPLAVCVLKGSVMFFCDLIRAMRTPVQADFMGVSSYGDGTISSGSITVNIETTASPAGRDVIIVEDIVDSGRTLYALQKLFKDRGARTVTAVTLLDKPSQRVVDVAADYSLYTVDDRFIVGYGLDYAQKFRDLPYICTLEGV